MGLSGPRKRAKISHDPNNTNWSRSTTSFGHKILTSQGWSPGEFLGARNAAHADSFTAASASHIRVALKDDNLGLGAHRGGKSTEGEPTGLDAFQGLLGRLNGKSDTELEKDQRKRDDIKLAIYAGNRWKTVNFIRAGLLEQEKLRSVDDREAEQPSTKDSEGGKSAEKSKECRKREKNKDRSSKDKKRRSRASSSDAEMLTAESRPRKSNERTASEIDSTNPSEDQSSSNKRKSKSKSKSKSKKRKIKEGIKEESPAPDSSTSEALPASEGLGPEDSEGDSSRTTKGAMATSQEQRPVGRRFIRGRNITQKKMALMDDRSLNEIFMVKL